jgi:hypothetical protein
MRYNFMVPGIRTPCQEMPAETSIGVSEDTRELLKESKEYEGQSYDDLLQSVFADGDEGESGG